jgi:type IV secretion system protein TrbL
VRKSNLLLGGLIGLAGLAFCSTALAAPDDLGAVLNQFQTASTNFGTKILVAAKWLAVTLATIDMILMLSVKLLNGEGPQEMMVTVIMRVMWYGFLTFLMNVGTMTSLIDGFRKLGEDASGISIVNPADIFFQGVDLVNIFMTKFAENANVGGVPVPAGFAAAANPLVALMVGVVLILIVLSFLVMTAQYAVILVQMYFFLACYPLIVSFGALKHGRDMSIKTISGAIVIGVKFLAVYFILYVAQQMGTTMEQVLKNFSITDLKPMWTCFGMAGLLAFLALKVPQMAADLLNGTVSLSGGDAMAAAAVGGGAAAAIAGGAASLAGGAASSVGGAIKAGSAAIDQARAAGASGLGGVAAGAVGALGSAGLGAAADAIKGIGGGSSGGGSMAERISSRTASITEAKAAGNPAAMVPGSQPAAPPAPAGQASGPAAPSAPSAPAGPQGSSAGPSTNAPGNAAAGPERATPPAPANVPAAGQASPPAPAAPDAPTADGAQPSAPARSVSGAEQPANQPKAPGAGSNLANNLVNELKRADSVQGASVSIQAPAQD